MPKTVKKSSTRTSAKVAKPKAAKPKEVAAKPARKRVVFTLAADAGSDVFVAGEFNGWDPTAKRLVDKDGSGVYSAAVTLAPGEYEYKFVINGIWCVDPNCREWRQNSLGTLNSVLKV